MPNINNEEYAKGLLNKVKELEKGLEYYIRTYNLLRK